MPTIPAATLPTVAPQATPAVFQNVQADPNAFGASVGQGLDALAKGMDQGADGFASAALKYQAVQNQTQVQDTYSNSFSPKFRDLYQKYYSLQGKDAVDQMGSFQDQMEALRNDTQQSMTNPAQQRMFADVSRRRVEMEMDSMSRYADQQNKVWQDTTHQSTLQNLSNQAADKYNDEQAFGTALGSGQAEIDRYAVATGKSADYARASYDNFAGIAATNRVQRWMVQDPVGANSWYQANQDMIPAAQRPALEHQLHAAVLPVEAKDTAVSAMTPPAPPAPAVTNAPDGLPKVIAAIKQVEGSGASAVSSQGATGTMQITPATFKDYAQPGESYSNEKDRVTVAERKIAADYQYYGGDVQKTAAAYIGGRGAVHADGSIADVHDALGTTAQGYAARVASLVGGQPQLQPGQPGADPRANLLQWVQNGYQLAEQKHPGDPVFRDLVQTQIRGYVGNLTAVQEGQQRQAHQTLIAAATGQPGQPKPLTVDDLMNNQDARSAWLTATPDAQRGVLALLKQNAAESRGEMRRSDPTLYNNLRARIYLPYGDPNKISSPTDLLQYVAPGPSGGGINATDLNSLRKEVTDFNSEGANPFLKQVNNVKEVGRKMLIGSLSSVAMAHPDLADEAAYRFGKDVDQKIAMANTSKKDPQTLFDPASPDYVLSPSRVAAFLPTEADVAARKAQALAPQPTPPRPAATVPNPFPTATNPKTGQRMAFKEGKWQPLQ